MKSKHRMKFNQIENSFDDQHEEIQSVAIRMNGTDARVVQLQQRLNQLEAEIHGKLDKIQEELKPKPRRK